MAIFNQLKVDPRAELTSISIKTYPNRLMYCENTLFDSTGLSVSISYSNGLVVDTPHYTITPDTPLAPNTSEIIISYVEGGKTVSTALPITVIPVDTVLDNNNWDTISAASISGIASNYWSIGDCKVIDVKGAIGVMSIDATYYAYIIGFNHNGATNTIDFGTFKSTDTKTDISLVDGFGIDASIDGTKYFNMNHSARSNAGGWKGCDLRYDILGSTKTKNSDAVSDTATNPVPNTLMAALPADLRAVMKPMTIYTDNVGGETEAASNVTASIDYLPLPARYEIGEVTNSDIVMLEINSVEFLHQRTYEYYRLGNSTIKHSHSMVDTACTWLLRTPSYYGFAGSRPNSSQDVRGTKYVSVGADGGTIGYVYADSCRSIAPIFRV